MTEGLEILNGGQISILKLIVIWGLCLGYIISMYKCFKLLKRFKEYKSRTDGYLLYFKNRIDIQYAIIDRIKEDKVISKKLLNSNIELTKLNDSINNKITLDESLPQEMLDIINNNAHKKYVGLSYSGDHTK